MRREEYDGLMELIDALISARVESAFGGDALYETVRFHELEEVFIRTSITEPKISAAGGYNGP